MVISTVYFIYGLAFFSMGLVLIFESARSPSLADARVLRPLAAFGFVHSLHEWLQMFISLPGSNLLVNYPFIPSLRLLVLTLSFLLLLLFSVLMVLGKSSLDVEDISRWLLIGAIILGTLLVIVWQSARQHADTLLHMDTLVRYLLAIPGAALAGVTLFQRANSNVSVGRVHLGKWLRVAAVGFFLYSATQLFGPSLDTFPGNVFNTENFIAVFGLPIQIVRAASAVLITFCLAQVIGFMEGDRREQFQSAQHARIDALEQLRTELLEREKMRRDLLRNIVIALEDERARISRELHDETSQTLTAFTFHLAVLRQAISRSTRAMEQIEYLQRLSRQMSQDIYRLVRDLRPAQLDDLGLVAALQYLVDEQQKRTGLRVHLAVSGEKRRLDSLVETVLFRVAQESLTNIARHAAVGEAEIGLAFTGMEVALDIEDHGCGFDPDSVLTSGAGLGLAGMQERVELIDGRLVIDSSPGRGTAVRVNIPLKGEVIAMPPVDIHNTQEL